MITFLDFSIEEIKQLLKDPFSSCSIIKAVKERVSGELVTSQKKIAVLSSLKEQTAYTVGELARELSKPLEIIHAEEKIQPRMGHRIAAIFKGTLFFLAVWSPLVLSVGTVVRAYVTYGHPIINSIFLTLTLLALIPSFMCMLVSRITVLQNRIFKTVLLFLCLLCIPLGVFTATRSVSECQHSFGDLFVEIEAGCITEGKVVKKCDVCHEISTETVERLGHTVIIDNRIAPTCSTKGLTEGSHCSVCGTVLVSRDIIPKTEHTYVRNLTEPTCSRDGYITMVCCCGESYREATLFANEKHEFKKNGDIGYRCSLCGLDVCEYGYADGDTAGRYTEVMYYITGTADTVEEQERTLVICGIGDMPEPVHTSFHPYRQSVYIDEIKAIVICDRITSIAELIRGP